MWKTILVAACLLVIPFAFGQKAGGTGSGAAGARGGASAGSTAGGGAGGGGVVRPPLRGNPTPIAPGTGLGLGPMGAGYPGYGNVVYDPMMMGMRPLTPQEDRLQRAMQKQRNLERQKAMLADTDRLLVLANSIQSDIGAADGKVSADTRKKADEIEKLAKGVQKKMRGEN
jgi:hypothetical protein